MISGGRLTAVILLGATLIAGRSPAAEPLRLAVMDPLAKQLSCPCVQGHAQRDYEQLASFLSESLGREVAVRFGESLDAFTNGGFDLVIGKRSVVESDAGRLGLDVVPIAALAGRDGVAFRQARRQDEARAVARGEDAAEHRPFGIDVCRTFPGFERGHRRPTARPCATCIWSPWGCPPRAPPVA